MLRKKKGVAVFLEQRSARVLEAEVQAGRLVVTRCGRDEIAPGKETGPEAMGKLVRGILDRLDIRADSAVSVVPAQKAIMRRLTLPAASQAEMERMVQFQSHKALPVGAQSMKVGYWSQDAPQGGVDVTVVGALHSVLDENRAAFGGAGLAVEGTTLSMVGAYNAFLAALGPVQTPGDSAWVEIGESSSDILAVHGGTLAFGRSLPAGESSLLEALGAAGLAAAMDKGPESSAAAGEWADNLATEINNSVRTYVANNKGRAVDKVYLSGRLAGMAGLARRIGDVTGIQTDAPASFPERIGWESPTAPSAMREYMPLAGALWANVEKAGIRFYIDGDFFSAASRGRSRARPILAAAAAVCVLAALFIVPGHVTEGLESDLRILKAEVDRLEKEEMERVKALEKKATELRSWTRERISWLDVLLEISNQKPFKEGQTSWGIYITSLRFREKEPIRMNGRAKTETEITGYAGLIQKSAMFKSADTTSFQKSDRKDEYPWSYEIVAKLLEGEEKK